MDAIIISKFIVPMCIGLTEEERATPQRIRIDAAVETDFSAVIATGILEDGVDCGDVRRAIREIAMAKPFILLEALGHSLAERLLASHNVLGVRLRIRKLDRWKDAVPGIVMRRKKRISVS